VFAFVLTSFKFTNCIYVPRLLTNKKKRCETPHYDFRFKSTLLAMFNICPLSLSLSFSPPLSSTGIERDH